MDERFRLARYTLRRKLLSFSSLAFEILDPGDRPLFVVKQKGLSIKGQWGIFGADNPKFEILGIKGQNIFGSQYHVFDNTTGETVGIIARRGLETMDVLKILLSSVIPIPSLSDPIANREWIIRDSLNFEIGKITKDPRPKSFWKKINIEIKKDYTATVQELTVAHYHREDRSLYQNVSVDFEPDDRRVFDRRLGLAAGVLMLNSMA